MYIRYIHIPLLLFFVFSLPCGVFAATRAKHAIVVSGNAVASEAGVRVLQQGGNAIDAAVAVGYALAVVFPEAGNIGGGGFALVRMSDGTTSVIDFRETAPGKATHDMYLDASGKQTDKSVNGHLSVAVPGTVAGLTAIHRLGGKLPMSSNIAPAVKLAEDGFIIDRHLAFNLVDYKADLKNYPSTVKIFFRNGEVLTEGDTLFQPDLASTLRRIQESSGDDFYRGETARLIVQEMEKDGGIITLHDLLSYKAVKRSPLRGEYRGYEILTMPPPSAGGLCLLEMLSIMEPFQFNASDFHSSRSIHLMAEAMKRAFADRFEYTGDPEFVSIPVDSILAPAYLHRLSAEIDTLHATPAANVRHGTVTIPEGNNTTHYVVADEEGNVVSVTYTLNDLFGSKVIVDGAGFFLNDEMDDFASKPGEKNMFGLLGTEKNAIHPGKRPVSSMVPTIVVKDGTPVMALGARGGPRIITAVFQTLVNIIDFKMNIEQAVRAPRFHHQLYPDSLMIEPYCFPKDVAVALLQKGYAFKPVSMKLGSIEAFYRDPKTGWFYPGADEREGGSAAGY